MAKIPGNMPNVSGSIFYPQSHKKICRSTNRGFIAKDSFNIVYWHKKSDETFLYQYILNMLGKFVLYPLETLYSYLLPAFYMDINSPFVSFLY